MRGDANGAHEDAGASPLGPPFRAYLEGDAIVLAPLISGQQSRRACSDQIIVQKRNGADWVPMIDDRPSQFGQRPGYYFDGIFVSPIFEFNCDVDGCAPFNDSRVVGHAEEYVKTGAKAPPPSNGMDVALVDVIESKPFYGEVRVVVPYRTDAMCAEQAMAFVALTIPADGVCCPVVASDCGTDAPRGGWAPARDACVTMPRVPDSLVPRGTSDSHGCAIACCGCTSDDDAGI